MGSTEQNREAAHSQPSEAKHPTLLEAMPDMMFQVRRDGTYVGFVPGVHVDPPLAPEEFLGKTVSEILPPAAAQLHMQKIEEALRTGQAQTIEYPLDVAGTTRHYEARITVSGTDSVLAIARDITERKRVEETLRASEARYSTFLNQAIFGIVIAQDGIIKYANQAHADICGCDVNELVGSPLLDTVAPESRKDAAERYEARVSGRQVPPVHDITILRKDGSKRYAKVSGTTTEYDGKPAVMASVRDVTSARETEEALWESEQKFRAIFEAANDGMISVDPHTRRFSDANRRMLQMLGYNSEEEIANLTVEDIHPKSELPFVLEEFGRHARGEISRSENMPVQRRDGTVFYASISSSPVTIAGKPRLLCIFTDTTERRLVEAELKQSEQKLRNVVYGSPIPAFFIGNDHEVIHWNRALESCSGLKAEEMIGTSQHWKAFYGEERPCMADLLLDGLIEQIPEWYSNKYKRSELVEGGYEATDFFPSLGEEGKWLHFTAVAIRDSNGNMLGALETLEDITKQKRAEEALHRLNRELRAISNCNETLLRALDEQTLLNEICRIVCDEAGYRLAWVGYAEDDAARTVRPVAWAGFESGYIADAQLSWADDTGRGRGPAGIAIRSGETIYVQDFTTDPLMAPWRESALQRGYRSGIALPLKDENAKVFGVLLIYSAEVNAITPNEIRLMEELAGDLAFGIAALRARAERKRAGEALRASEANYRAIFDTANDAIFLHDAETGAILDVNQKMTEMYGFSPEEAREVNVEELSAGEPPYTQEDALRWIRKAAEGEPQLFEWKAKDKTGTIFWVEVNLKRAAIAGNERLLAIVRDITERKHSEERIMAALEEKDALLKEIHHRVKNNMQIISSLLHLQASSTRSRRSAKLFRESQDRIRSLALIHDKLYHSQSVARIDLAEYVKCLVDELFNAYSPSASGILVNVDVKVNSIMADMDTSIPCGLIINELVTNALKHAFPGGRTGEIRVRVFEDGDKSLTLLVSDNGVGIPATVDAKDPESLGLQLVNALTRQLNGTVQVDSIKGTSFKITFPWERHASPPEATA